MAHAQNPADSYQCIQAEKQTQDKLEQVTFACNEAKNRVDRIAEGEKFVIGASFLASVLLNVFMLYRLKKGGLFGKA